jgi:hypothetical protein
MKSAFSGMSKTAILGVAIATTGIAAFAWAMPATAAKSYKLMLTDVPEDATSVWLDLAAPQSNNHTRACYKGMAGQNIDTHLSVVPNTYVTALTYTTSEDCSFPGHKFTVGKSPDRDPVPTNLAGDTYPFQVGPITPREYISDPRDSDGVG